MIQIWRIGTRNLLRALALALFVPVAAAHASTFKVLYSFTGGSDGGYPAPGSLVFDAGGNLYGATALPLGEGSIFKLAADGSQTVLYYFAGGAEGSGPAGVIIDRKGNLWGTTCCGGIGCGVIFEIKPNKSGYGEKLIHVFEGSPGDGCSSGGALLRGSRRKFYGTTVGGGKDNDGTVFEIATDGTEQLIHSFNINHGGYFPVAGPIKGPDGALYGADVHGGSKAAGTIFEIAPDNSETTLYTFKGSPHDGAEPQGGVIGDQSGNLYGTLRSGGVAGCAANEGCGALFKLAPDRAEAILHFFTGENGDGANPEAGLIADSAANLYGTTYYGGGNCTLEQAYGCGTVFKLSPDGTETILYSFSNNNGANGAFPSAGLVADNSGNLYGTASGGGLYGCGTIFEITP
jgi:uncharacterized repeat protein (TIGR03803 family)